MILWSQLSTALLITILFYRYYWVAKQNLYNTLGNVLLFITYGIISALLVTSIAYNIMTTING